MGHGDRGGADEDFDAVIHAHFCYRTCVAKWVVGRDGEEGGQCRGEQVVFLARATWGRFYFLNDDSGE